MPAAAAVVDRTSALEFLFGRINYERTVHIPYRTGGLKLDRMQQLLGLLGDPHVSLPVVHIAGTKGKGSTATMIARMLQAAGYRTGLYTSPHFEQLEERFVINGQLCSDAEFVRLAADLQAATAELEARDPSGKVPTFFELTTAMGFLHFARSRAEIAVMEVGLGGRLDSTNVCRPLVSVITSISFDHVKQLGNTLAAIAREKAGIIKQGVPVVSSVVEEEPRGVIELIASEWQARLITRGDEFDFSIPEGDKSRLQVRYREPATEPSYEIGPLRLGMIGEHQAVNAATAIAAVRSLPNRFAVSEEAIASGLAQARCPARIEVLRERPTVIVDVAHNVASIVALVATLLSFDVRRRVLVFASSRDKDTRGMLSLLLPHFDHVIVTRFVNNPRAVEPAEVQALAIESAQVGTFPCPSIEVLPDPASAWQRTHELAGPDDMICVTGSFFLAAELRTLIVAQAS
jgi:dihydrofolate synthase/folylpolyglutamate synthase